VTGPKVPSEGGAREGAPGRAVDRTLADLRRLLAQTDRMREGHRALLAVAEAMGMESEIDHQRAALAEWDGEAEMIIEQAAAAGYGPEDFE
jgi:hypothetical protein